jgi:predicted nucleic acid-binding Zn ribbon protein
MRRKNSEHIRDIISRYIREEGIETPLNQYRILQAWTAVMGEGITQYTGEMFIKSQTLYIKIKSSALRQELSATQKQLVQRLNSQVNAQVITEIRFY